MSVFEDYMNEQKLPAPLQRSQDAWSLLLDDIAVGGRKALDAGERVLVKGAQVADEAAGDVADWWSDATSKSSVLAAEDKIKRSIGELADASLKTHNDAQAEAALKYLEEALDAVKKATQLLK